MAKIDSLNVYPDISKMSNSTVCFDSLIFETNNKNLTGVIGIDSL